MSYNNLKSEISQRSSSCKRSSQRLRSSSFNLQEGLSSISHVNGTANPQRVIELNLFMKENPAKYRLKQEYLDKYRNIIGTSTLQIREKIPKDLKVRIQDVEHLIDQTKKIENAHKRLNQKVEDIILANQPYCAARIQYIQDTDEKVFYKVNCQPRAKENNVIMNNPVFNTLYDDVMQNRAVAQESIRSINEANPENPFRDRYIQIIQNSEQCPQKYKDKLLEPLQKYIKSSKQQDENNVSRDESMNLASSQINHQPIELSSAIYKYHNEENFNKIRSRKSYQSGKPFYGTNTGNDGFYKRGGSFGGSYSLNQTYDESLNKTHQNQSSTINSKDQSRSGEKQTQQLFKVQHANKLNSPSQKPNFKQNLTTYANLKNPDRDMKLFFYQTYSQQNSPFKIQDPTNPADTIFCKDAKKTLEYKRQADINYYEKQANQYQTHKKRIPKLTVNHYAVQNKNSNHIYLHPKDKEIESTSNSQIL